LEIALSENPYDALLSFANKLHTVHMVHTVPINMFYYFDQNIKAYVTLKTCLF